MQFRVQQSKAEQLARREYGPFWDCLFLHRFETVFPHVFLRFLWYIVRFTQTETKAIQSWGRVWTLCGTARCFCNRESGVTLASCREEKRKGGGKKGRTGHYGTGRSARETRVDHGKAAAASATGSRGPRGSLPGPWLDATSLPCLSRSPRWGRPKLSTTSTTRRHHIWWNCRCRRTKSRWQTSKMSSRNQITNSSSNLWTMTSGNC